MRKDSILLALALVAASSTAAQAQAGGQLKVAYINLQSVVQQDPGYAVAESTFRKEMDGLQKNIEKLQQQFDSSMNEYNKQAVVLSPSAKQAKEKQLQTMQQSLQQKAGDFQSQAQKREQELIGPIEDRVRGVIEGIRAERNLSIIFDAGSQTSNIIAADRTLNITDQVIQRLKAKEYPALVEPPRVLTAREIASLVGGELLGPADIQLAGVAPLDRARPGEISLLSSSRYLPQFERTGASAVLLSPGFRTAPGGPATRIVVD